VPERGKYREWTVTVPTWKMKLKRDEGDSFSAHMIRDQRPYDAAQGKLADAHRWKELHDMRQFFGNFQSVYARTVHTSQGETHKHTFLDVPDIRRRMGDNPLEMQQLCYVGATRPTTSLILAGI
jgi:exodeoxyribonuclease-5